MRFFGSKIWQIVTSCRERRDEEYEKIGWWDFIGAEHRSLAYQKLLGHGITRSLVAAKARTASTKTIGDIFVQLLFDIVTPGPSTDRVLNGPTNDVWIDPWRRYLESRGVAYHLDSKAVAVSFDGQRIRSATVERGGSTVTVQGDYFIFALPVEDVIDLITPDMIRADPALGHLFTLDDITEWMNGIQIYLKEDVPLGTWPQHLRRFSVGADVDFPGAVLAAREPLGIRRRHGEGHHLGRYLRMGRAGLEREGRQGLHA